LEEKRLKREKTRKRRFGVAIPESLARALDELVESTGTDRSRLVGKALSMFMGYKGHEESPHNCIGVFIVGDLADESSLSKLLDEYHNIIVSYNHVRIKKRCVTLIVVSGFSEDINQFYLNMLKISESIRLQFVPLYCLAKN
jgi:metal-responsive CopG/Arc/MetJ family transcriptional regulator